MRAALRGRRYVHLQHAAASHCIALQAVRLPLGGLLVLQRALSGQARLLVKLETT